MKKSFLITFTCLFSCSHISCHAFIRVSRFLCSSQEGLINMVSSRLHFIKSQYPHPSASRTRPTVSRRHGRCRCSIESVQRGSVRLGCSRYFLVNLLCVPHRYGTFEEQVSGADGSRLYKAVLVVFLTVSKMAPLQHGLLFLLLLRFCSAGPANIQHPDPIRVYVQHEITPENIRNDPLSARLTTHVPPSRPYEIPYFPPLDGIDTNQDAHDVMSDHSSEETTLTSNTLKEDSASDIKENVEEDKFTIENLPENIQIKPENIIQMAQASVIDAEESATANPSEISSASGMDDDNDIEETTRTDETTSKP